MSLLQKKHVDRPASLRGERHGKNSITPASLKGHLIFLAVLLSCIALLSQAAAQQVTADSASSTSTFVQSTLAATSSSTTSIIQAATSLTLSGASTSTSVTSGAGDLPSCYTLPVPTPGAVCSGTHWYAAGNVTMAGVVNLNAPMVANGNVDLQVSTLTIYTAGITAIGAITGSAVVRISFSETPRNGTRIPIFEGETLSGNYEVTKDVPKSCKTVRLQEERNSHSLAAIMHTDNSGCGGLSGGAIAGIVCGAIALSVLVGVLLFFAYRHRHKHSVVNRIFRKKASSSRRSRDPDI